MIVFNILAWIFVIVLLFIVNQFAIVIYDALNTHKKPIGHGAAIALEVMQEAVVTFISLITYALGFINYDALFLKKDNKKYPPVLLVHGYMMNRACFFYVHLRLVLDGFRVFTVNLYPPVLSITDLAERVADKMDEMADKTGEKEAYLVGHSMGGLVTRYYSSSPRGKGRVKRIITIASPHKGTRIAVLGIGKDAREMIPGSEFINELNKKPMPPLYALWSTLDNLIVPPENAFMEGMPNDSLPLNGHIAMLFSNTVYRHIVSHLKEDTGNTK
jgi:triacylglycerol lipase